MQVDSEVKKALGLTDQQYTNQFPFEACLVMKHHLAETIHKVSYRHVQCASVFLGGVPCTSYYI
jgi:predicted nucleic acid-binding protein